MSNKNYKKRMYAMLTNQCNLSCPHCDVKRNYDGFNEEAFLKEFMKFDGLIVLFGGEATLHKDRFLKMVSLGKANSVATNLTTDINDDMIAALKKVFIGTSWNPHRFNDREYKKWLSNLKLLEHNNIDCRVLITLTDDLLAMDIQDIMDMILMWDRDY